MVPCSCSLPSSPLRLFPPQICRSMLLRHHHHHHTHKAQTPFLLFSSPKITFTRLHPIKSHLQQTNPNPNPNPTLLPKNLQDIVALFQSVQDPKAKYHQLLHYATTLPPLDARYKTDDHRVRGCVSQVWVRAFPDPDDATAVRFEADSDSSLTKGLAALLVMGLSGSPATVIAGVSPEFVRLLGLRQSLTPSRNNGFLNMLRLMQQKALQLHAHDGDPAANSTVENGVSEDEDTSFIGTGNGLGVNDIGSSMKDGVSDVKDLSLDVNSGDTVNGSKLVDNALEVEAEISDGNRNGSPSSGGGMSGRGERIRERLRKELSPVELEVEDISYEHDGHAGVRGSSGGETHFNVRVVSKEFEGKSMVKRHRIVYDLLQEELQNGLHALSIVAKTPSEVN